MEIGVFCFVADGEHTSTQNTPTFRFCFHNLLVRAYSTVVTEMPRTFPRLCTTSVLGIVEPFQVSIKLSSTVIAAIRTATYVVLCHYWRAEACSNSEISATVGYGRGVCSAGIVGF